MKNYWRNLLILWGVSLAVDYWIATKLASSSRDVWNIFILLMLVPMFFMLKSALIRTVMWNVVGKRDAADEVFNELITGDWPTPDNYDAANPEDYLTLVVSNDSVSVDTRIKAANILGMVAALNANQQILAKIFWTSSFKTALKRLASIREGQEAYE